MSITIITPTYKRDKEVIIMEILQDKNVLTIQIQII